MQWLIFQSIINFHTRRYNTVIKLTPKCNNFNIFEKYRSIHQVSYVTVKQTNIRVKVVWLAHCHLRKHISVIFPLKASHFLRFQTNKDSQELCKISTK